MFLMVRSLKAKMSFYPPIDGIIHFMVRNPKAEASGKAPRLEKICDFPRTRYAFFESLQLTLSIACNLAQTLGKKSTNLLHKSKFIAKRTANWQSLQNEDKGGARMRILAPIFFLYEILKPKMSSTRKKRC